MLAAAVSSTSTWLQAHRSRYLLLLLCSPILIPFIFASLPFLCAAEIFLFLYRSSRNDNSAGDEAETNRVRWCEEGGLPAPAEEEEEKREEMGLLQRYLEDQLSLVGPVYGCVEFDEDSYRGIQWYRDTDSNTPLLS